MAKRSRKESNSSEDEGGGEQEEEKEEGEASDEENEWKIYYAKKDNESNECESTRTLVILKIKLEIKACSKKWQTRCGCNLVVMWFSVAN